MSFVYKVALPGINALTDNDPTHFSIFEDDNSPLSDKLIKEFIEGKVTLGSGITTTIPHNLGYIPFFIVITYATFVLGGNSYTGYIQCSSGGTVSPPTYNAHVDPNNLYIENNSGDNADFFYFIFYDQQNES